MKALITAAGMGTRMGSASRRSHKGLRRIAGVSILRHAVNRLQAAGISQVYIVVGHQASQIRRELGKTVEYIHNPFYGVSGILGSVRLAMPYLDGKSFLFTTGDHFFASSVLARCLSAKGDVVSLVQHKPRYHAEDSKVMMRCGRITRFGKDVSSDRAGGEYGGLTVFRRRGSIAFFHHLRTLLERGGLQGYVMDILNRLLREPELLMSHVTCAEESRIEIDTPADLRRARRLARSILTKEVRRS